jgi:hypothetical protein
VIEQSDICKLVTFPLIGRSTVEPLEVVARTVFGLGLGIGVADGVGVGVGACVGVGVAVCDGVWVGVGVGVGVGDGEGEGVGVVGGVTVNELLVPVWLPSAAVMVTLVLAAVTVTEVEPTPLTKALMELGLIDPVETVKEGEPV